MKNIFFILLSFIFLSTCSSVQVVKGALFYPVNSKNQANQVVVSKQGIAYFSLAEAGIGITDVKSQKRIGTIALPSPMKRVDVITIDNGILFALDVSNGLLSSFSIASPRKPFLVSSPIAVPVQDRFNGMSASRNTLIISGGTSGTFVIFNYDNQGQLSNKKTTDGYAFGQPKVQIHPDGTVAYIAFHNLISDFGFSVVSLKPSIKEKRKIRLQDVNYTKGGSLFGNFPVSMKLIRGKILAVAYERKVDFFDTSNPHLPRYIKTVKLDFNVIGLDSNDRDLAVVGSHPKPSMSIIDVRSIKKALIVKRIDLEPKSLPSSVAIFESSFIVAARQAELAIILK